MAGLTLLPGALAAQRAPDRSAVLDWRDSLAGIRDTTPLLALESRHVDIARQARNDPLIHLRLGFVGLRLAELTGGATHFRDAEGEFEWAAELKPQWPLPWYGLGEAELLEADRFPTGIRGLFAVLGHDIFAAPARDLARSARVDSTFVDGVLEVGNDALRRGVGSHLQTALAVVRDLGDAPAARNPGVLLVRGRVEREVGDVDSAITAFNSLVATNTTHGTALLELARTELAAGRIAGVTPWYAGLAVADSATLAMYRFDLSLVMSDSMLRVFDAARPADRVAVARGFWESRDPDAVNAGPERLREHYRRLDYAHRNYALVPPRRRYDTLRVFDPTGSRFDDRGRIYVRHGEPDDRTSLVLAGLPPNESWVYHRPGGDLLFNFAQPDSAQGYRMYESLLDIVGLGAAAQHTGQGDVRARLEGGKTMETYGAAWTAQAAQELLYSREKISPLYGRMLSAGPGGARAVQSAERAEGRKSIAIGLQTDSWKMGYELPLSAVVDVLAVGSTGGAPQLQVVFAIPGASLYAPPSPRGAVYPIRTRVAVRNAAGETIVAVDTTRNFFSPGPIPDGDNLLGRLPIAVPPGDYTVRVALETPSRGVVSAPFPVHVAALATPSTTLSDIALGARSVPLPWRVGASDSAWINPLAHYRSTEPMQLFFEVGGVTTGGAYHIGLAVTRSGHHEPELQLGTDAVATRSPDRVHRELDIARLAPGTYTLEVTVSTAAGGSAVRRREFTVVK